MLPVVGIGLLTSPAPSSIDNNYSLSNFSQLLKTARTMPEISELESLAFMAYAIQKQWGNQPEKFRSELKLMLDKFERATTSCHENGVCKINGFVKKPINIPILNGRIDFQALETALRNGKTAYLSFQLPEGGDHVFWISPTTDGKAKIEHAWQGRHRLRDENPKRISAIMEKLQTICRSNASTLEHQQARVSLFGESAENLEKFTHRRSVFQPNEVHVGEGRPIFKVNYQKIINRDSTIDTFQDFLIA